MCSSAFSPTRLLNYFASGQTPPRIGNAHVNLVPYQVFAVADGHVVIAVGNDGQFAKLCAALGQQALAEDARFRSNPDRVRNRDVLVPILAGILAEKAPGMRCWTGWSRRMCRRGR